jgi:hypothetical protein
MTLVHLMALGAFFVTALFSQDEDPSSSYTPPPEHAVTAAQLPEKIKAAFAKYLPEQKPENCKWHYTESEQQTDWNKKKKKYMKIQKVRLYVIDSEPKCVLKASDPKSPEISFMMNDQDKEPIVSSSLGESSPYLPKDLVTKARELSSARRLDNIDVTYGAGGKPKLFKFGFSQGLTSCTVKLDAAGQETEKPECFKGAYGGME